MGAINMEEAKEKCRGYANAIIYLFDGILVSKGSFPSFAWENCLEARFFDEKGELRIWRDGREFQAAEVSGEGEGLIEKIDLQERYTKTGKRLVIKKCIDYDRDGQAYVRSTLLLGLED